MTVEKLIKVTFQMLEKLVKSLWRGGGGEVEIRKPNKVINDEKTSKDVTGTQQR